MSELFCEKAIPHIFVECHIPNEHMNLNLKLN